MHKNLLNNRLARLAENPNAQSIEAVLYCCERLSALASALPEVQALAALVTAWAIDRRSQRVVENMPLVHKWVGYYSYSLGMIGVSPDDAAQEGALGLIRAAELFDESRGFQFSTYAVRWIRQFIHRLMQKDSTVKTPDYLEKNGSGELPPTWKAYREQAHKMRKVLSLDFSGTADGKYEGRSMESKTPDPRTVRESEVAGVRVDIAQLLQRLGRDDATVLRLYYLAGFTLNETAVGLWIMGIRDDIVTKERVRQLIARAIEKARAWSEKRSPDRERWLKRKKRRRTAG